MPGFDYQGARNAGYSDTEIADILSSKAGFNAAGARQAGYSDADIINRLTSTPAPAKAAPAPTGADKVAAEQGVGDALIIGAGRTFDRIGKGVQQAYYAATGNDKELAALKQRAQSDDEAYAALQKARPFATAAGEALPSMVVPIGGSATALGAAGKIAAAAATPELLSYGSVEDRLKNAAGAAAGGVVGGVAIPKAVGAAVNGTKAAIKGLAGNITPEAIALAERAKALGIPVNAAQLGDSKFLKTLSSQLEQMPFTGAAAKAAEQRAAFTNAVGKTFGADVQKITPEVYAAEKKRLGEQFNLLSARNELNVDDTLRGALSKIEANAEATASDDTIRAVRNILGRVSEQAETTGGKTPAQLSTLVDEAGNPLVRTAASETPVSMKVPGTTYSSIDTELGNMIKAGGEKGMYAKRLQATLREGMDKSITPADQEAWRQARNEYRNLKAVRDIVAKERGDGDIPPTALMAALNSNEAGKEAMAMGARGTLGELGQVGRRFVRDSVPNSGTAQRAMAMGLMGAGGMAFGADPQTIAGMVVGGATVGRLITKALNDPRTVQALARKGLTVGELAKLPPSRVVQILGGITGQAEADNLMENQ